jgi:hypothetical protein
LQPPFTFRACDLVASGYGTDVPIISTKKEGVMSEPMRNRPTSDIGYADRIGRVPWSSRVSWSAILAGLFVAMAAQLMIYAVSLWGRFGLGSVTSVAGLAGDKTVVGYWTAVAAFVGVAFGSFVAAWIAGSRKSTNGIWHGVTVWGLTVVLSLILSGLGVAGLMGFGLAPSRLLGYFGITGAAAAGSIATAAGISTTLAGWFLLASFASLIAGVIGGALGVRRRGAVAEVVTATETEREERRAA